MRKREKKSAREKYSEKRHSFLSFLEIRAKCLIVKVKEKKEVLKRERKIREKEHKKNIQILFLCFGNLS